MGIITSIIGMGVGVLLIKYRYNIWDIIGDFELPRKIFGSKGTHHMIVLVGIFVFLVSFINLFGGWDGVLQSMVKSFYGEK